MTEKWEEMKQDKKKRKRDMDKERVGEGTRSKTERERETGTEEKTDAELHQNAVVGVQCEGGCIGHKSAYYHLHVAYKAWALFLRLSVSTCPSHKGTFLLFQHISQ